MDAARPGVLQRGGLDRPHELAHARRADRAAGRSPCGTAAGAAGADQHHLLDARRPLISSSSRARQLGPIAQAMQSRRASSCRPETRTTCGAVATGSRSAPMRKSTTSSRSVPLKSTISASRGPGRCPARLEPGARRRREQRADQIAPRVEVVHARRAARGSPAARGSRPAISTYRRPISAGAGCGCVEAPRTSCHSGRHRASRRLRRPRAARQPAATRTRRASAAASRSLPRQRANAAASRTPSTTSSRQDERARHDRRQNRRLEQRFERSRDTCPRATSDTFGRLTSATSSLAA